MFEAAADGIATFAPDLAPLRWERFISGWVNIPNDRGELSKSETTLVRTAEFTAKLNVWVREDTRGNGKPMPHNHPWETFTGHVLLGGYDEDRYRRNPAESASDAPSGPAHVDAELGVRHASPAANTIDQQTYHEIIAVHQPCETLSLMICGRGRRGAWHHLDVDSGRTLHEQPVANFDAMFAALNPHLR